MPMRQPYFLDHLRRVTHDMRRVPGPLITTDFLHIAPYMSFRLTALPGGKLLAL